MAKNSASSSDSLLLRLFPTFAGLTPKKSKGKSSTKGNTQSTKRAAKPRLPMVNLLPPRLELEKAKRATRRGFIIAGVGVLITTSLLWTAQTAIVNISAESLTAANTQLNSANSRLETLKPVKQYFASILERQGLINEKTGTPVDYTKLTNAILAAMPSDGTLKEFSVKALPAEVGAPATDPTAAVTSPCGPIDDPFSEVPAPGLACLNISGLVGDRSQISALVAALKESPLLRNVSILEGASPDGIGAQFLGSAMITDSAADHAGPGGK